MFYSPVLAAFLKLVVGRFADFVHKYVDRYLGMKAWVFSPQKGGSSMIGFLLIIADT
jgi:hypothetical protein